MIARRTSQPLPFFALAVAGGSRDKHGVTIGCHFLISWHLARHVARDSRERRWIGWAGVVPDLDGVGMLVDQATRGRTHWYEDWHHVLGHNFLAALIWAIAAAVVCSRGRIGVWAWVSFQLHMVADLISGRGPDGSAWPLVYGWPVSRGEWQWSGQWRLDAWPNTALFVALLVWAVIAIARSGRSPLELISTRLDQKVLAAFRSVLLSRRRGSNDPVAPSAP